MPSTSALVERARADTDPAANNTIATPAGAGTPSPAAAVSDPSGTVVPLPRKYKLTEMGNAERFVDRFGENVRYCPGIGWLVWQRRVWSPDTTGEVERRMKDVARSIWDDTRTTNDRDERSVIVRWAKASESHAKIKAALRLAQSDPRVVAAPSDLDADPWLFNVGNGTIDLRTGELRPHRREDLMTKISPARYDPDARAERWDAFLERITDHDVELIRFLQRATGYSMVGENPEEVLFFLHGPAATGKSTFIEAIKGIFGTYAVTASFDSFLRRRGDRGIPNDIARLAGARLVIGSEAGNGQHLDEALLKQLTGGDTVTARKLYQEYFEFEPQFVLWLLANSRPDVDPNDPGIWRRLVQIPFIVEIPEAERDPGLKSALRSDPEVQAAILAWAVEGCLAWQRAGLQIPDRVRLYTAEYREEADPFAGFFADRCVFDPAASSTRAEVRRAYSAWTTANGLDTQSDRALAAALRRRGVEDSKSKVNGERGWSGVRLAPKTSHTPPLPPADRPVPADGPPPF